MQQQEFVVSREATLSLLTRTSAPGHLQNFTRLSQNDFPQNFARSSSQNPQAHPRKNFHTSTPNTEHLQDLHARAPQGTLFGWRCQGQFLAWSHPNFSWIATTLGFGAWPYFVVYLCQPGSANAKGWDTGLVVHTSGMEAVNEGRLQNNTAKLGILKKGHVKVAHWKDISLHWQQVAVHLVRGQ